MILRFKTPTNKNGNSKQIEFDTQTNIARCGYFLFHWVDAITITPKGYKEMLEFFAQNHIQIKHD